MLELYAIRRACERYCDAADDPFAGAEASGPIPVAVKEELPRSPPPTSVKELRELETASLIIIACRRMSDDAPAEDAAFLAELL